MIPTKVTTRLTQVGVHSVRWRVGEFEVARKLPLPVPSAPAPAVPALGRWFWVGWFAIGAGESFELHAKLVPLPAPDGSALAPPMLTLPGLDKEVDDEAEAVCDLPRLLSS